VKRVSQPYAPGETVYWTTYNYDTLGRTISVVAPDGASTGTYLYQGNTVKVTDPAGNWKIFTTDALGNLTQVTEPNPAGGANLETYYTYNLIKKLIGVSMPRSNGTQTRSFQYDDAGRVTVSTNPENGTVRYYYNGDGTLNYKTDAKGQKVSYDYDSYQRVTNIHRYPNGTTEDLCQATQFTYDSNPVDPAYSQNAWGRVTVASWGGANCNGGALSYMYSYTPGGLITGKRLRVWARNKDLNVSYTHNNEGQMLTVTYPDTFADGETVWGGRATP